MEKYAELLKARRWQPFLDRLDEVESVGYMEDGTYQEESGRLWRKEKHVWKLIDVFSSEGIEIDSKELSLIIEEAFKDLDEEAREKSAHKLKPEVNRYEVMIYMGCYGGFDVWLDDLIHS